MQQFDLIRNLPSGIIYALWQEKEYSVTGISKDYVAIRIGQEAADRLMPEKMRFEEIRIDYLDYIRQNFRELMVTNPPIAQIQQTPFYKEIVLGPIQEPAFQELVNFVIHQYTHYIFLKNDSCLSEFSKELCDYPEELDWNIEANYKDFALENSQWEAIKVFFKDAKKNGMETAIYVSDSSQFGETLVSHFQKEKSLLDRIYIGNEYCSLLLMTAKELEQKLYLAKFHQLGVTLMLPPLKEQDAYYLNKLLTRLSENDNAQGIELVVNDFGSMLQATKYPFRILAGTLLLKARKDPRSSYRLCPDMKLKELLKQGQFEQRSVQQLLLENGIVRVEMEGLLSNKSGGMQKSYHFPLYQTNTSSFCTLKALLEQQNRGYQIPTKHCSRWCEAYYCAYPKHLQTIGLGNSIFALQEEWKNENIFTLLKNKNVNRVVCNIKMT